jgi:hypothetical protein
MVGGESFTLEGDESIACTEANYAAYLGNPGLLHQIEADRRAPVEAKVNSRGPFSNHR